MRPLRVLDLFSGIGGFSLGLERAGMKTVAFCEIEAFPRRVLAKHWPEVPCYDDVRTLTAGRLAADGIAVDVICGGFPCQDISAAGKGAGLAGERSGLWSEYARLIGEIRPRFVIVENVAALLGRGLDRVLGDLAALGFDAEWHCIPASAVGAPHRRDRVWIVAYPNGRELAGGLVGGTPCGTAGGSQSGNARQGQAPYRQRLRAEFGAGGAAVADANGPRLEIRIGRTDSQASVAPAQRCGSGLGWWLAEPDVGRVAHGVSGELDGGSVGAEEHDPPQSAARNSRAWDMPVLRDCRKSPAPPSLILGPGSFRDALSGLPYQSGPAGRASRCEADEGVRPLRGGVSPDAQQEAHPLQPSLPVGSGADQRRQTLDAHWLIEPDIPRVARGVTGRVNRLRGLGNAVVPQIPEIIGRAIIDSIAGESGCNRPLPADLSQCGPDCLSKRDPGAAVHCVSPITPYAEQIGVGAVHDVAQTVQGLDQVVRGNRG